MKSQTEDIAAGMIVVVWFGFLAAMGIGWVLNCLKLFWSVSDPISTMTVIRAVGIFVFPLGCVVGWA